MSSITQSFLCFNRRLITTYEKCCSSAAFTAGAERGAPWGKTKISHWVINLRWREEEEVRWSTHCIRHHSCPVWAEAGRSVLQKQGHAKWSHTSEDLQTAQFLREQEDTAREGESNVLLYGGKMFSNTLQNWKIHKDLQLSVSAAETAGFTHSLYI